MSLNLNWGWKGIDFNMFWQTVLGRDMYNQGPMVVPFYNDNGNVWKDMVDKRWTADNPTNRNPRLNYDSKTANTRSSYYIYDASFLRLKISNWVTRSPYAGRPNAHVESAHLCRHPERLDAHEFPGMGPRAPLDQHRVGGLSPDTHLQLRPQHWFLTLNTDKDENLS